MANLFADDEDEFADPVIEQDVDAAAPAEPVDISPKSNPDLLGHEDIEKALLEDFNAGRLPHAIILAGPSGIGKSTLAYRLARFLLSQGEEQGASLFGEPSKPETFYISPENPVFKRVTSGGHADLLVIGREFDEKKGRYQSEISVETVRRITPFLRKTAAEGGWRAVIVEDAEYLNINSQNALLKILEEPPKKTLLILTTSQPGSFLPTIRSRCRVVNMEPLSEKNISTLLDKFAPGLMTEQKIALSRLSEGSIGKALNYQGNEALDLYKTLLKNISSLPDLDIEAVHALAEKIGKQGAESSFDTAADIMVSWCSRLARLEARGLPVTDVLSGDAEIFQKLMKIYPPRYFLNAWERMAQLFMQAERYNLDKRQAIMNAFLILQKPDFTGPII